MKRIFIIIIEPGVLDGLKHSNMLEALKKDPSVISWWHHITNTYILITRSNVTHQSVQEFVQSYFLKHHFLVLEIPKVNGYNGWLPQEAWDWIEAQITK